MRWNPAPRIEIWLCKSSFDVTPGSPCTARKGSSARTLARFFSSLPAIPTLVAVSSGNGPAVTLTDSERRSVSGARAISRSGPGTVTRA